MNDKTLAEFAAEFEAQNEEFAQFEQAMRSLGDVELAVPKAFLDELEATAAPYIVTPNTFTYALRG